MYRLMTKIFLLSALLTGLFPYQSTAQQFSFFRGGTYDASVPTPESVVGFPIGERPLRHHEVVTYLKTLAQASPRVQFVEAGKTHEGRLLSYAIVSSEEHIANLPEIQDNLARLADPRTTGSSPGIADATPAVAWMMYSIHGDELSGVDAGVQLTYQLAAGTDSKTMKILRELVVGIDPMENPDGRERYLAQMEQWGGPIQNSDGQSIQHTGVWPWGRGNHYLFDLNRDWFILAHPESRVRVKAISEWHPQLVVDGHEMGSYDTYLFNPPREPINPGIGKAVRKWWQAYSAGQAAAFDEYGWSYYTREWYDDWYPGYGSSWPSFTGATGLLYEQAQTDGSIVKKPNETVATFRDAVHHQFVSSIANLATAAEHRSELLKDFYSIRKQALKQRGAYFVVPGKNPSRARRLVSRLRMQGIEVEVARQNFTVKRAENPRTVKTTGKTLPKGTYVVRTGQPLGHLVTAILEFDPRMLSKVLQKERENLERGKGSHLYEVTSWSMLLAYDVEAYYAASVSAIETDRIDQVEEPEGSFVPAEGAVAYLCDYSDDNGVAALLAMFQRGLKVRAAKEPFEVGETKYPRGTLLLRVNENPAELQLHLSEISQEARVDIRAVKTLRIRKGPDLGGGEFTLLEEPRIAMLSGQDLSGYNIGATWYLLDHELDQRFSILNHDYFNNVDLRKYNVLVLPSAWGGLKTYHNILGKAGIKKLKDWVSDGGTLIGINNAAAFLADSSSGLSKVELKRQALKNLSMYAEALQKENAWRAKVDSVAVWDGTGTGSATSDSTPKKEDIKLLTERDKRHRLYQPRGATLRVDLEQESWLCFGLGDDVPAISYSSYAFMAKKPVQTVGRFSNAKQLRLSGLLWPEARQRWADTAYATREAHGKGQVILFAGEPNFRSYYYGTTRMLLNSMLLGPGMGTKTVVDW